MSTGGRGKSEVRGVKEEREERLEASKPNEGFTRAGDWVVLKAKERRDWEHDRERVGGEGRNR